MTAPTRQFPEWVGDWTPSVEQRTAVLDVHPLAGLAALLGVPAEQVGPGRPVPLCWHWAALSQWPREETVARDGHPRTGNFLPTTPYPRRVWTGVELDIHRPPLVGERVTIERSVTDVSEKAGSGGPFALVTVTTILHVADVPAMTERVRLAYLAAVRPAGEFSGRPEDAQPRIASWLHRQDAWRWQLQPDPVVLMWFSALTANPHRIHYDRPYAREVEGHPDLLVHGPLMALALAEVVRQERPDDTVRGFSCRATRPLTVGRVARTRLLPAPETADVIRLELAPAGPVDRESACMTAEVRY